MEGGANEPSERLVGRMIDISFFGGSRLDLVDPGQALCTSMIRR